MSAPPIAALAPGSRVFLLPDPASDLGWVGTVRATHDGRVRIDVPPPPDGFPPLAKGATARVARRDGGAIELIAARVLAVEPGAIELEVITQELVDRPPRPVSRRHLRAALSSPCDLTLDGTAHEGAWLGDLGAGGAEVILPSATELARGLEGTCVVTLPGEDPWTLAVRVVRARFEPGTGVRAGLAFVDLPYDIETRIDAFVHFARRTRLTRAPL